ncbi:MAG: tRNA uridine-5-carboxymethylaminomethyl(34) synthesis GTPase MnmE [Campylobacterota bacterium]|nr:tRNA uridine-5-carboxymethylaminomethyl(34) synthesis GTPase MnmE [Campylobacterota bacterium]
MVLYDNETIVSIATANGIGAISIVRVSGSEALNIALNITKKENLVSRYATLSKLYNFNNELIDEALIIYFKNPQSFTGEDIVEFQCHGGVAVSNMIIDSCLKYGARIATAGEFSKRAFLNGKIDLTQAQAISKIIEARSEDAVKLLAKQLKGELKDFVEQIRKELLFMLAYTEVNIDYAEEDLPLDIYEQIEEKIKKITNDLNNTLDSSKRREGMIDGYKVAIIGKPNVGKSSLLNKLLNFNRAIVSDIAGTTRDTIEESVKIGSHIIKIVDTAGIREASDAIEKIGIEKSHQAIEEADIVVVLFDRSRVFDDEDKQIQELIKDTNKEIIVALTKTDLDKRFEIEKLDTQDDVICLNTKENISSLVNRIENILNKNTNSDEITLISKLQVTQVEKTLKNILDAKDPLKTGELEFFAFHINEALDNISQISRPYEHTQMLDVMFGEFCLGK